MQIEIVRPSRPNIIDGNVITAERWASILRDLGNQVSVRSRYSGTRVDLLIVLHARRSCASISAFRNRYPEVPLIVALTGTDLYKHFSASREVLKSLGTASRLIVLQRKAIAELPEPYRAKTWVIYQSARTADIKADPPGDTFVVAVVANLSPEKDPFRTAMAVRKLPLASTIRVSHAGSPINERLEQRAKDEEKRNPRYKWLGGLTHDKTLRLIASSRLVVISSQIESGSNVLSEALVSSVPVLTSHTPGLVGMLGDDFPGYFPVGDTGELARLLRRVETDAVFYDSLKRYCGRAAWLVRPEQERASLQELLNDLSFKVAQKALF
jgi:putative glycosyltransferase (TIGR04348 family)